MVGAKENGMEKKHDYYAPSKNEDFAALEQVVYASFGIGIFLLMPVV